MNLSKKYGNFYALKDVNLELPSKGLIGISGESGSGKINYLYKFFREKIMSKKKIYNKHIEKGKFYSVNGHPGMIFWKNDKKNRYKAVVTGTSEGRHKTRLKYPTEKKVEKSFVNNRPVLGRRSNFGSKELKGMRFHKADKPLINVIKRRKPTKLK